MIGSDMVRNKTKQNYFFLNGNEQTKLIKRLQSAFWNKTKQKKNKHILCSINMKLDFIINWNDSSKSEWNLAVEILLLSCYQLLLYCLIIFLPKSMSQSHSNTQYAQQQQQKTCLETWKWIWLVFYRVPIIWKKKTKKISFLGSFSLAIQNHIRLHICNIPDKLTNSKKYSTSFNLHKWI